MDNQELLHKLEESHAIQAQAILEAREAVKYEDKLTTEAKSDFEQSILQKVQLNISEFEILALELEAE